MFAKRLLLTCMLLGSFNQIIPSTDRHSAWIEHIENKMVKELPAELTNQETTSSKKIEEQDNRIRNGLIIATIAGWLFLMHKG